MKLQLICRFNGGFLPFPPSGRLRYTGGEMRILWIDRNIVFTSLKSKIAELIYLKGVTSFSLFYHLPVPESSKNSKNNVTPVLIASSDDVQRMIDDFEKIEFNRKPSRLWLFVCREINAKNLNLNLNLTNRSIGNISVKPQTETPVIAEIRESNVKDSLKESANIELQTIENSDLEYVKELGSGAYGIVYYGKWIGSDVAIKKIKPICLAEDALDQKKLVTDFWKEAQILRRVQHPNVIALYGVVSDGPLTNWATVIEYMVNGSLKQVLQKKDRTIDRRKRVIIAMDVAFGMEYLHEKNIVHFDLKSHNIFVNLKDPQRPVCKIGDLGLSRIKQSRLVAGGIRGTIRWMAPELLNSSTNQMVSEKVDVYSYGIILWELLTGEEPYASMRSSEIIVGVMKGCLRPKIPYWCDPWWRSLMEKCWLSNPVSRPSFSEIAKELIAMTEIMNIKY